MNDVRRLFAKGPDLYTHSPERFSSESDRDVWIPEYRTQAIEETGSEWPTIIVVERWERNLIGESRFVETRQYLYRPAPQTPEICNS